MTFEARPDVPCGASADQLDMEAGAGSWIWRVTVVTPRWWHERIRRVYLISAASDTLAAREGLRRFVEEERARVRPPAASAASETVH